MPIKTWVASKDGKSWASNRTRDVLDLSFVVYKHKPGESCTVEARSVYPGGQRAKWRIGVFSFSDHKEAKRIIEDLVLRTYINQSGKLEREVREAFFTEMLDLSGDMYTTEYGTTNKTHAYYNNCTRYKPVPEVVETEEVPETWAEIAKLAYPENVSEEGSPDAAEAVDPGFEVVDLTPSQEMINTLVEAFDMDKAVDAMMNTIEEVEEVASAVIAPAPKTITINGKTITLGWPS